MSRKNNPPAVPSLGDNIRLDPEKRLTPSHDSASIDKYPVASREKMGLRVVDDFCEEHIQ